MTTPPTPVRASSHSPLQTNDRQTSTWLKNWPALTALSALLVGFALRLSNLSYHSLWFDEAVSVRWAQSSVPRIIEVSMNLVDDRLPPLYYLLLKFWAALGGYSEFSLRFLSVICGVLLVAVMYKLGQRLFGPLVGGAVAGLTALNPFLIWYSQEARMYALAVLLGAGGVLSFVIATESKAPQRAWRAWLGLGLCALAGLYTHLYTGFLWPALAIWLLLNPEMLKKVWLAFGLTMGAVSALFLPLALAIWRFSGESTPGDPLSGVSERAWGLFRDFTLWQGAVNLPGWAESLVLGGLFAGAMVGLGVCLLQRRNWLFPLLLIMPFVVASGLMVRSELAFFGERYFIVMVPWLLLLQAIGVVGAGMFLVQLGYFFLPVGVRQWLIVGLIAVSLGLTAIPIPGQWSPSAAKEAWRQSVVYLNQHAKPNDAVFIHPEWVRFPYQYYEGQLGAPAQTYAYFFSVDETSDLDGPLNGILGEHPVIWLIQAHLDQPDPERRVENWFAVRFPLVTELYPPGITLKGYAPGYQLEFVPPTATPVELEFAEGLTLVGFEVPQKRVSAQEELFHPPSGWVAVRLYWQAEGVTDEVIEPYVHLTDEQGQVWGASLARGNDSLDFYPPTRWEPNQVVVQYLDVNLNPATPPGSYNLVVGVGERQFYLESVVVE